MKTKTKEALCPSHNSRYTLRSSLPSVVAVLGLRHIFSAPAFGLFGAEKTSHSGKRYVQDKARFYPKTRPKKPGIHAWLIRRFDELE